jgi:hypothetical protein
MPWGLAILFLLGFGALAYVLSEVLTQLKRAPEYLRRARAEWLALAEKVLRT